MIDIHNLIGKYAVGLFPLGGVGGKIYVWAAFEIKHYREHPTFPSCYKILLDPIGCFVGHVTKDSFYTNDLTLKEPKEMNTQLPQPHEWSPFYVFDSNLKLAEVWAKALNNVRSDQGFFPDNLPADILEELGEIGCLRFQFIKSE